ncbi:MAG: SpoIIIAC/SpoIIIAD family protein [Candidatus Coproplasma sp.]
MIIKLCCVAVITGVCALILRANKPEFVPMCITAGGILLILFAFDYLNESIEFIKNFTEQTGVDSAIVRVIFKVVGVGYLIEITASSIKDLGFDSLSDKLVMCGKIIIFSMSLPILQAMFKIITSLINLV